LLHGSNTAPLKGLAFALKVIAQLKKMKYNVHLNVVGSMSRKEISFITGNNYKRYISALIRQEDLVSNVSFLGHLNELQMRDAFLNVDAYFQSSFIENSSNMLLEAQVVGCPVIVGLPCGGSSDMLFRSNVFKYELGNINDCIEVIVSNFLNPKKEKNYLNLDEEVMHNMHKYVDGTEIAKEYIFIYSDILGLDVK
jgi:glycosyltransferase involved in cell wall biosynthesis